MDFAIPTSVSEIVRSDARCYSLPQRSKNIEDVMTKIAAEADRINLRIVVADAGSTDGTREIVQRLSGLNNRIVLMDNPGRIQAIGINNAVRRYGTGAKFLIRVDAHSSYPNHYCEQLLRVQTRTNADSVVVSMYTAGNTCFERAAAAAQNSILGHGGSAHRNGTRGSWVDHGHHALMTIDAFAAVGGYDESFSHNEDAELDARLKANDFHIYLTGETHVTYHPRKSAKALFQQYFKIGQGRARNFLKHRKNTKLRHLVLVTVAPALGLLVCTIRRHLRRPSSCLGAVVLGIRNCSRGSAARSLYCRRWRRGHGDAGGLVVRVLPCAIP